MLINRDLKYNKMVYACYNKNEEIRLKSSSGGIFSLLAQRIILNNGVVFGAIFNNKFEVVHSEVDSIENLDKLYTSKYVQSKIGNCFKRIKVLLDENKKVLFTGTPCQIAGLKSYLNKDYNNLICQDIICHGVPSPKIWKIYLNNIKDKNKKSLKKINMRDKRNGWKQYNIVFEFDDISIVKQHSKDLYIRGFCNDLYLRPSCYKCKFKGINRYSDITLADFWGIENILPSIDDNKGTSLVIIHSEKGKMLFNSIKKDIIFKNVNINNIINYNSSMIKSANLSNKREKFFKSIEKGERLEKLIENLTKISIYDKFKYKIRNIILKIDTNIKYNWGGGIDNLYNMILLSRNPEVVVS